jgi:hypothetical protein
MRSALLAAAALAMVGCQPQHRIELHYRPGNGVVSPFAPRRIAVRPAGDPSITKLFVGTVFDPDSNVERLFIVNPPEGVGRIVAADLDHAGLKATVIGAVGDLPEGIDYVASCIPEALSVTKRVDKEKLPAENSFLMEANARLRCSLSDRLGTLLLSGEFSGSDSQPPLGASRGEQMLSDPGEALAAAISYAVDGFMNHPDFRRALPGSRTVDFNLPALSRDVTPSATPTPEGKQPSAVSTPHRAAPAPPG